MMTGKIGQRAILPINAVAVEVPAEENTAGSATMYPIASSTNTIAARVKKSEMSSAPPI
jgi:hypothetical protein